MQFPPRVTGWFDRLEPLQRKQLSKQPGPLWQDCSEEDAVNMIVNGFCKEVFRELPMEFAVEAQKLLEQLNDKQPEP